MVIFDQLRISDNGSGMYIDFHVSKADYFDDIYLDSITILTADQVSETSPELYADDYIYQEVFDGEQKEQSLFLRASDFNEHFTKSNLSNDLFFVYVKCKGVPSPCTPCRFDEETALGVVFDESQLYQCIMSFTKELVQDCAVHDGFIDFILLWNAFKACVETEHYIQAIKFWKLLFETCHGVSPRLGTKGCGCHG